MRRAEQAILGPRVALLRNAAVQDQFATMYVDRVGIAGFFSFFFFAVGSSEGGRSLRGPTQRLLGCRERPGTGADDGRSLNVRSSVGHSPERAEWCLKKTTTGKKPRGVIRLRKKEE